METDVLELSTQVNDEFTLMSLFFRADLVVKLVILMLFAASIFSWAIIIQKIKLFKKIKELSDFGVEGLILSWLDFRQELQYFGEKVLPLLEQEGLRFSFNG